MDWGSLAQTGLTAALGVVAWLLNRTVGEVDEKLQDHEARIRTGEITHAVTQNRLTSLERARGD